VYKTALKSNDEMFHVALYDWLLCKQMPEKLLSVRLIDFMLSLLLFLNVCVWWQFSVNTSHCIR